MQKLILISLLVYDAVGLLQGVGVLTSISESVIEAGKILFIYKKDFFLTASLFRQTNK